MPSADRCERCRTPIGPDAKVQPQNIDGKERLCPSCFVHRRMHEDPQRFNATQACVAQCTVCRWTAVSYGTIPGQGRLRCGHCGAFAALRIDLSRLHLAKSDEQQIEDAARDAGFEPHRLSPSRSRPRARA